MDKFEGSLGSVIITWTDIDELFNVDDEHFIVGVRELLAMQMYASERYTEAVEKKRNAPKGRSNGI